MTTEQRECFFLCGCEEYIKAKRVGVSEIIEHIRILDGGLHSDTAISFSDPWDDFKDPCILVGGGIEDRVCVTAYLDSRRCLELIDPSFTVKEFKQSLGGQRTVRVGLPNVPKDMAIRAVEHFVESGGECDPELTWVHDAEDYYKDHIEKAA